MRGGGKTQRRSSPTFPLVPVGVWLGVWMNRRCSKAAFLRIIYVFVFLAGLQLVTGCSLAHAAKWFGH